MELNFDRILAIIGIVSAIVLVVLDKAGKLRGPVLLWLLGLAALMTVPLAVGNSWVKDTPWGMLKFSKIMLGLSIVTMGYSILAVWVSSPNPVPNESERPSITPPPLVPYVVRVDTTMYSPRRDSSCMIFIAYSGLHGQTVSPVNAALFLTIVNDQSIPVMLSDYSVEMRTADDSWAPLIRLSAIGKTVYMGSDLPNLSLVSDNSVFLDTVIVGRTIQPHDPVRGWSLFEYPKGYGPTFVPEFKVIIKDYEGTTYNSPILASSRHGKTDEGAQIQGIPIAPGKFDLSKAHQKYWSDPVVP